jgi:VanZ family protein
VAHAIIFGGLAGVVSADLCRAKGPALARQTLFLVPILFAIVYGLFDEFHQLFVLNRSFDILDLLADSVGAIVSASAFTLHYDRLQRRKYARGAPRQAHWTNDD